MEKKILETGMEVASMVLSLAMGPQNRFQNTVILTIETQKKAPKFLENLKP